MNNFYGKRLNAMQSVELTLLSLDIDLINLEKSNQTQSAMYSQAVAMREVLVAKCEGLGGDYSRSQFMADYNGTPNARAIETNHFDECEIITLALN